MKSKVVIWGCVLAFSCVQLFAQDADSILNVRIERGDDLSSWSINLIIENIMQEDTLLVGSNYVIDEPTATHILINFSPRINKPDFSDFIWGASQGDIAQNRVFFSDERLMRILPRESIVLRVPISHFYIGRTIFLDIRMVCRVNEDTFFVEKRTNKLLFEREPNEHERFQAEQARIRRERMQAEQEKNAEKEVDCEKGYEK